MLCVVTGALGEPGNVGILFGKRGNLKPGGGREALTKKSKSILAYICTAYFFMVTKKA